MHIGLILKVSKFCNLRCRYCCEMDDLANPRRMSVADISKIFVHLREFLDRYGTGNDHLSFYWHGGEPLVHPMSFWDDVALQQKRALGDSLMSRTTNAMQSNLTLVKPSHLRLFKWTRIGFSYDVVNRLRVDRLNRPTTVAVENKIAWLTERGVGLAGIVVVSAANVNAPDKVSCFYLERGLAFRVIQLDEALEHRSEVSELRVDLHSFVRFVLAIWNLGKTREAMAAGLRIDPLNEVLAMLNIHAGSVTDDRTLEDLATQEHLLEVDIDGRVYSTADYPYRWSYGNLFDSALEVLLTSSARYQRIARSADRFRQVCSQCRFFRHGCIGTRVSHATEPVFREYQRAHGCELKLIADAIRPAAAQRVGIHS